MIENTDDLGTGGRQAGRLTREEKLALLAKLFPSLNAENFADDIRTIELRDEGKVVLRFKGDEADLLQVEGGTPPTKIQQLGFGQRAWKFADSIADKIVTAIDRTAGSGQDGAQQEGAAFKLQPLTAAECNAIAQAWSKRGFQVGSISSDGVYIEVKSGSWLCDRGQHVTLVGQDSDEAILALMHKASAEWDGRIELFGTGEYKQRAWQIAATLGVTVIGYEPPPTLNGARAPSDAVVAVPSKPSVAASNDGTRTEQTPVGADKSRTSATSLLDKEAVITSPSLNEFRSKWSLNDVSDDEYEDIEPFEEANITI